MSYIPVILFFATLLTLWGSKRLELLAAAAMDSAISVLAGTAAGAFTTGVTRTPKTVTPMMQANARTKILRLWMQFVISLIAIGIALFILFTDHGGPTGREWACGTIGTVIGFWLNQKFN